MKENEIKRLFFDFYVLNELWFNFVGAQEYGYVQSKFIPWKKERAIDYTFRQLTETFKEEVVKALEISVRKEIRHFNAYGPCGPRCIWSAAHHHSYTEILSLRRNFLKQNPGPKNKLSLEAIKEGFELPGWDDQYGGPLWAVGVGVLLELKKSKTLKDDIFWIDRALDLYHNTGFLLNKTAFRCLEGVLWIRFEGSFEELVKRCSSKVKRIYTANKNFYEIRRAI